MAEAHEKERRRRGKARPKVNTEFTGINACPHKHEGGDDDHQYQAKTPIRKRRSSVTGD